MSLNNSKQIQPAGFRMNRWYSSLRISGQSPCKALDHQTNNEVITAPAPVHSLQRRSKACRSLEKRRCILKMRVRRVQHISSEDWRPSFKHGVPVQPLSFMCSDRRRQCHLACLRSMGGSRPLPCTNTLSINHQDYS